MTETATPTPDITETPVPETIVLGDVDRNESVDAADALEVLKYAAKLTDMEDIQKLAADVNKDLLIDASDALDILKYAAKLIVSDETEIGKPIAYVEEKKEIL